MRKKIRIILISWIFAFLCNAQEIPRLETGSQNPMPDKWIDKDTGHKIVKLVHREGSNRSFYFHNNPFLAAANGENKIMIFYGGNPPQNSSEGRNRGGSQLYSVNLKTMAVDQITNNTKRIFGEIVGKKRREVFYQHRDSVFATNVDNHETRLVYVFPDSIQAGITTLNADETLLAGAVSSPQERELFKKNPKKSSYFDLIYEAKLKRSLFTLNIESGEFKKIYSENAWLNHVQFSPTDPELLMYCHEGPWHKVDRIWTININNVNPLLMHKRSVNREIAGHEFFSVDGKTIWFDLQIPRGETFYLAGVNIKTGQEKRYAMKRDEWSIHFNISPDQKLFAGDGGDSSQVAHADNGMWIYLFTPAEDSLKAERLVNMKHHNYDLEPNVHFSPDGRWIIFRANFEGHSDIYAVEIMKN